MFILCTGTLWGQCVIMNILNKKNSNIKWLHFKLQHLSLSLPPLSLPVNYSCRVCKHEFRSLVYLILDWFI